MRIEKNNQETSRENNHKNVGGHQRRHPEVAAMYNKGLFKLVLDIVIIRGSKVARVDRVESRELVDENPDKQGFIHSESPCLLPPNSTATATIFLGGGHTPYMINLA